MTSQQQLLTQLQAGSSAAAAGEASDDPLAAVDASLHVVAAAEVNRRRWVAAGYILGCHITTVLTPPQLALW